MTRLAQPSDLKNIAVLFSKYREFYKQESKLEAAEQFLTDRMNSNESVIFVVEDSAAGIIGFAQLYPSFSSVSLKRLWILNDLFVASEHRGKGAAGQLLGACAAHAKDSGARGLTLKTAHDNVEAQRLYEAHGWKKDTVYLSYNFIF
jgi:GNAT superfamily N-acetyltransferase